MTTATPGPYTGRIAQLYANVSGSTPGTRASPTWVKIARVNGDNYTPPKRGTVEGEIRSQRQKLRKEGSTDLGSLKFSYVPEKGVTDAVLTMLLALSAPGAAPVELAVMDDIITYTGATGDRFFAQLSKVGCDRDLGKIVQWDFEATEVTHYESGAICHNTTLTI